MARPFSELYNKMSPEARARVEELVAQDRKEMALEELRKAKRLTQAAVAAELHIDQGAVSKIEKQSNMHLSTLRGYIEAVGGKLELRAVFPGEAVDLVLGGK
jgi:DNA-binding XRE family transcriptional regulator